MTESYIAIHTWSEHGYFAADLFFCGAGKPKTALQAQQIQVRELERGFSKSLLPARISNE